MGVQPQRHPTANLYPAQVTESQLTHMLKLRGRIWQRRLIMVNIRHVVVLFTLTRGLGAHVVCYGTPLAQACTATLLQLLAHIRAALLIR